MTEITSVNLSLSEAILAQLRDNQPMLTKILRSVGSETYTLNILIVQLEYAIEQLKEER